MPIDTTVARSRRALLATAVGAGAATIVSALVRPLPVRAGTDGDVVLGATNTTANVTAVTCTGYGAGATGLIGVSNDGTGVYGLTKVGQVAGLAGRNANSSTGVFGWSTAANDGPWPAVPAKTGVYGYAAQDSAAVGVKGQSTAGTGVLATATTGTALHVAGKASFSRSGRATVLKRKTYVDIAVAGGLTSRSVIHATLQTYRSGVAVAAVRRNYPTTGNARIYLTKVASTTSNTYVAWLVTEY